MIDSNNNRYKRESFMSASRLSALAPPFTLKTHDQELSFNPLSPENYNLEVVYDYNYGCYNPYDDPFQNETNSFRLQYPSKSIVNLLDSDAKLSNKFSQATAAAASMPYNSFLEDENTLSYSPEYSSSQGLEIRPSGANKTSLLHKLGLSDNADSCGDDAVINENYSGSNPSTIMEPDTVLNIKDNVASHEKIPIAKGKEKQNGETVINEAIDTLVTSNTDLSPDVLHDFSFESFDTESGVHVQISSVTFDENDSDVDSPCWKGTGVYQSPFQVPEQVILEPPKAETNRSLNPLAPDFFPGSAKPVVEYLGNKSEGNDSLSFRKAASSVVLLPKEHRLINYVKAGTYPSEVSNVNETQFSGDIHDAGMKYSLPNISNRKFVLNSSFDDGSFPAEEQLISSSQGLTGANVSGSAEGIKPSILNGSTCVSFPTSGNPLTSFSSRDGVSSDFTETLSKSAHPKIDVQLVINTMHDLSELLRWSYSNDLNPINEHEHAVIQHIVNNLSVCITKKVGETISISESGHLCTSHCPVKLTDCQKAMRMKPGAVAHDWERQKNLLTKLSKQVMDSSSSRSYEGIKKG